MNTGKSGTPEEKKRDVEVKRPQRFGMKKIGMKGKGTYTPPPEHSTNEDKGD